MGEQRVERRLAAILAADVAGYSRLMGADEVRTVADLRAARHDLIDPKLAQHHGRLVNSAGDSVLVEFPSVVDAVRCAVEVQQSMAVRNADVPENQRIVFRVGINVGDVIFEGGEIYGDGVNVAARLEQIAEPGSIYASRVVRDRVQDKLDFTYDELGPQKVKNVARPVEVFRIRFVGTPESGRTSKKPKQSIARFQLDRPTLIAWSALAVALVLIVRGGVGWALWHERFTPASAEPPGIAVLPFNNLSDDKSQEYFSDGIPEDIITEVSHFSRLKVIARNSTFRYNRKPVDIAQVRAELGVRYVVEGSVRRAGDQVRITSQLIDTETGGHIWAERYDRPLNEIVAMQDELIRAIVPLIVGNVLQEDLQRAAPKPTSNLTAYDLSLLGRKYTYAYNPADLEKGREAFEKAIAADPAFADAYVGLAGAYDVSFFQRWGPVTGLAALDKATTLLNQAISLNPRSADAWATLGLVEAMQRHFDEGISALEKARKANSNSTTVQNNLGTGYRYVGRVEDAVHEYTDALKRDPFPLPYFHFRLCQAYFLRRRYSLGLAECGRALEQAPSFTNAFRYRAAIYAELGDLTQAKAAIAELLRLSPTSTVSQEMESLPFKARADQDRFAAALRKAGLPERWSGPPNGGSASGRVG